jgi:hypothetical protein
MPGLLHIASECKIGSRGTAYVNKKTQIASNYEEQGKIRTIYCEEKGAHNGDPSHPPPPPAITNLSNLLNTHSTIQNLVHPVLAETDPCEKLCVSKLIK